MIKGSTRQVYVLMWTEPGTPTTQPRAMFTRLPLTAKRTALKYARGLQATVYPVPYPGTGWDCPTIRATFDPIYTPPAGEEVTPCG